MAWLETGGAAAAVVWRGGGKETSRSLLLMVKYVDRVGTEVQQSIGPSYAMETLGAFDDPSAQPFELIVRGRPATRSKSSR